MTTILFCFSGPKKLLQKIKKGQNIVAAIMNGKRGQFTGLFGAQNYRGHFIFFYVKQLVYGGTMYKHGALHINGIGETEINPLKMF
jgi:hypothetical protein